MDRYQKQRYNLCYMFSIISYTNGNKYTRGDAHTRARAQTQTHNFISTAATGFDFLGLAENAHFILRSLYIY